MFLVNLSIQMSDPECFRKIQSLTLPDEFYTSEERTPALGLRGRRSDDYFDGFISDQTIESHTSSVSSYVWSNLGFLLFGLFVGLVLGVIGHLFYILHGNLPRPRNLGARNYTFSSDH